MKSIIIGFVCLAAGLANLPWIMEGRVINFVAGLICFAAALGNFIMGTIRLRKERVWRRKLKRWGDI